MRTIYCLVDPRTNVVRYVGRTGDLARRTKGHLGSGNAADKTAVGIWVTELSACGLVPTVNVLEECDDDTAPEREAHWIRVHSGPSLMNKVPFVANPVPVALSEFDMLRVAVDAVCSTRTVRRYLATGRVHDNSRALVERSLRRLGLQRAVRAEVSP